MVRKQVFVRRIKLCRTRLWRRSNQALLFFSLLFIPNYLFSADLGTNASPRKAEDSDQQQLFHNYTYEELEQVYERAPREVKHLITKLQHPKYIQRPQLRVRLFKGDPGTEKTTTMFMVCYKLRHLFKYQPIDCAKSALKLDPHHAFDTIVDNFAREAVKFSIKGGDGIVRSLYQVEGSLNGVSGVFEWIVDPRIDKGVTHRLFIKGGTITGTPNMIPRR